MPLLIGNILTVVTFIFLRYAYEAFAKHKNLLWVSLVYIFTRKLIEPCLLVIVNFFTHRIYS
jgi:hypothetical protein